MTTRSKAEQQSIRHESNPYKYFTMMLNMADDDLNPHEYRLLGHYVRWAGHGGSQQESIRQTAKVTRMGKSTVDKTRDALEAKGYIKVVKPSEDERKEGVATEVIVLDRWAENIARYAKDVPDQVEGVYPNKDTGVPKQVQGGVPKQVDSEELNTEEHLEEQEDSAAIATDPPQPFKAEDEKSVFDEFVDSLDIDQGAKEAEVSKTTPPDDVPAPRKRNHTMDAVCIAFKIEPGGYAQLLIKQLTGIKDGLKGKRLEYLIDDPPMTAIEILACRDWYGTDPRYKDKGALPATAETIFERVLEFRAQPDYETWVNRAGAAFMARTDEDIETPAELPPPNKDMKERVDDVIARLLKGEPVS